MKNKIRGSILLIVVVLSVVGCKNNTEKQQQVVVEQDEKEDEVLKVVTTIFPAYDFVREIAGDKVDVSMLLPLGAESHSFEPSPKDIIKIQNSDLFIYVGGESDRWVEQILESMGEEAPQTVRLMDCVETLEEEIVEGMQEDHDHEHGEKEEDHEDEHESEEEEQSHGEDVELDEHIWTSPKNAIQIVNKLTEKIQEVDASKKTVYEEETKVYIDKLTKLDAELQQVISEANRKKIVVGDRFPFRYLAYHYGLEYAAAFPGCSTTVEPSVATIAYLSEQIKNEKLPVVLHIELSSHKVADTLAEMTGAKVMQLHSCHNVTKEEFEAGATYSSLMKQNIEVLKEALN